MVSHHNLRKLTPSSALPHQLFVGGFHSIRLQNKVGTLILTSLLDNLDNHNPLKLELGEGQGMTFGDLQFLVPLGSWED